MKMKIKMMRLIVCLLVSSLFFKQSVAQNWDLSLLKSINSQTPTNGIWKAFSSTAEPVSVGVPLGLLAVGLINKDYELKSKSLEMIGSIAATAVATEALKIIINRDRPYQKYPLEVFPYDATEKGKSFPSAHTSLSFATATSLALTYHKWYITIPALAWATGVGYSRLYLGEHYPSDVLAGAIVGTASAYASHWANKHFFRKKK